MAKRNVSPRVLWILFFLFFFPINLLETPRIAGHLSAGEYGYLLVRVISVVLVSFLLARTSLYLLGFPIRSRSVEPLKPAADGDPDGSLIDLPLRITYSNSYRRQMIGGAIVFIVMCPWLFWYPLPRLDEKVRLLRPIAAVFCGLIGIAAIVRFLSLKIVCEMTVDGINAPDDYGSSGNTFVPWDHLVACEFIYDELGAMCDHFVLRDRAGRPRFRSSGTWLTCVSPADRTRIVRALRSRFPQKANVDSGAAPVLVASGSPALWDRELDR